jgi:hypothetical protein
MKFSTQEEIGLIINAELVSASQNKTKTLK